MSGDTTMTIRGKLTMLDIHMLFDALYNRREVTVKLGPEVQVTEGWHEIELLVIAAHEARVRGLLGEPRLERL